jgi:hypothetical protein
MNRLHPQSLHAASRGPCRRRTRLATAAIALALGGHASLAAAEPPGPGHLATGLQFLDPGVYQAIPLAAPSFGGPLPERAMVSPLPSAGNQGQQSSCVGWAIAGARSILTARRAKQSPDPPDRFFSPAWIYNQIRLDPASCRGFSYFLDGLNLLTRDGIVDLATFPYHEAHCHTQPTTAQKQRALQHRVPAWRRVNTVDETEVKTHLASANPVLVGMFVGPTFQQLAGGSIYQGNENGDTSGHAMVVVGYDDSRGAFRLLNSWGTEWGDSGYGWVSYPAFRRLAREGYVLEEAANGLPTPSVLELETVTFEQLTLAARQVERKTEDHHCESNCRGEPTRTNYKLDLAAEGDTELRNPELRCVQGPCHGWNEVRQVSVSADGKLVSASWDVWTRPTTWRLSAEVVRRVEAGRVVRRIPLGSSFTVSTTSGAPPPQLLGRWPDGTTFTLTAGKPTGHPDIRMVGIEINGPETIYRYETN